MRASHKPETSDYIFKKNLPNIEFRMELKKQQEHAQNSTVFLQDVVFLEDSSCQINEKSQSPIRDPSVRIDLMVEQNKFIQTMPFPP